MEPTWLFVMMLALVAAPGEVIVNGRPAVVIESPAAKLVVDLGDGSIVDFHLGPRAAVQHVRTRRSNRGRVHLVVPGE